MYSGDNNEFLPINNDQAADYNGTHCWVGGKLDWGPNTADFNTLYLTTDSVSSLGSYTAKNPLVYWCPSDRFVSPRRAGWVSIASAASPWTPP